jgi:hypothetical protein
MQKKAAFSCTQYTNHMAPPAAAATSCLLRTTTNISNTSVHRSLLRTTTNTVRWQLQPETPQLPAGTVSGSRCCCCCAVAAGRLTLGKHCLAKSTLHLTMKRRLLRAQL